MANVFDAKMLKKTFLAGTKRLDSKQEWINELNVFPVPDGDTGTNMTLTLMNAVSELEHLKEDAGMEEVSKTIASGTLRGARGNSGVIMSQLVRGFSKEVEGHTEIDKSLFADACDRAVKTAYKAVMKPKEGTILTVSKAVAEKASELCKTDLSLESFFTEILKYAEEILEKTPDMLPVLKEAGVVDSGGQGLVEFLAGALDAFLGKDVALASSSESGTSRAEFNARVVDTTNIETSDIKFGYCTEFIVNLEKEFSENDEGEFKQYLSSIGDSIVCVSMDDVVKVHVHTNHPGEAIEKALTYGSLTNLKIDNMRFEHTEKVIKETDKALAQMSRAERKEGSANALAEEVKTGLEKIDVTDKFMAELRKEVGFVAVCSGDGLAQIFKGMSVDEVIEGGQTMNPSTDDILEAINKVNADNVFILPNNKNIVLAAQQAAAMTEDKNAIVIPTSTVCQGINAVINYIPALSIEDNTTQLTDAAKDIKTAEITHSIRDTEIDGTKIQTGDYMGIGDGQMLAAGAELKDVVVRSVKAMMDEWSELITIYYGADVTEEDAQEIADLLEPELEDADIEVTYGGQPVYYYIISVE